MLILINEIEQRAKIIFLSAGYVWSWDSSERKSDPSNQGYK